MKKKEVKKEENKKEVHELFKSPRVTEKASALATKNVYTFNVSDSANKTEIKKTIFKLYKVKPMKVNIVSIPNKKTSFRGKSSLKEMGKKAMIYLKKGDKIEF